MKTLLTLLGITVGLATSLSAQVAPGPNGQRSDAGPYQAGAGRDKHPSRVIISAAPQKQAPAVYYVTSYTATGSHIPVVVRRYKGVSRPVESGFRRYDVFTASEVGATGYTDLSSALRKLEPDIL